jgi:hypothetical protein
MNVPVRIESTRGDEVRVAKESIKSQSNCSQK